MTGMPPADEPANYKGVSPMHRDDRQQSKAKTLRRKTERAIKSGAIKLDGTR